MCSGLRAAHEILKWEGIGSPLDMKLQLINQDKLRCKLLDNFQAFSNYLHQYENYDFIRLTVIGCLVVLHEFSSLFPLF